MLLSIGLCCSYPQGSNSASSAFLTVSLPLLHIPNSKVIEIFSSYLQRQHHKKILKEMYVSTENYKLKNDNILSESQIHVTKSNKYLHLENTYPG